MVKSYTTKISNIKYFYIISDMFINNNERYINDNDLTKYKISTNHISNNAVIL